MPFVPVPNTCLVEMRMTYDLQQVENTLYFEFPGGIVTGAMQNLANDMEGWWNDSYAPLVVSGVQLREVVVTDLTSSSSAQVTNVPASVSTGAVLTPGLPSNVTLTVSFRTSLRGRSFRGRNYVVGIPSTDLTPPNTIEGPVVQSWIDAYQGISDALTVADALWVVVSRFSGVTGAGVPIPRTLGVTTPITNVVVVDQTVDSQRRRLPGRGK